MEDVGIFNGHLVHFTVFCYILWTFGTVLGNLVYSFPFCYTYCTKKNLATLLRGSILGVLEMPEHQTRPAKNGCLRAALNFT
jgi:hypothetical protein